MRVILLLSSIASLMLVFTGCKKAEVTTYEVPKEKSAVNAPFLQAQMQTGQTATPIAPEAMASGTLPPGHPEIGTGGDAAVELPPGHPEMPSSANAAASPGMGMPPSAMAAQGLPPGAVAAGETPEWAVPASWKPGPVSSMRKASFLVQDGDAVADISVTAFPGNVGGGLANLNRWRAQIGLPPTNEAELAASAKPVKAASVAGTMHDLSSAQKRMIVVTLPVDGVSWFFKITGDTAVIEKEQAAFLGFVQSVRFN
ncbi:MAG: hypothetical protein SFY80_02175 [Verrucomicrobiota bacterium]|nr:hypothetical protein [Verrucomicrobiota bacterium]